MRGALIWSGILAAAALVAAAEPGAVIVYQPEPLIPPVVIGEGAE